MKKRACDSKSRETVPLNVALYACRKNPKVEKHRSAVHELYMRPYNYVSYEMGGAKPTHYHYHSPPPAYADTYADTSSSSSSSYPPAPSSYSAYPQGTPLPRLSSMNFTIFYYSLTFGTMRVTYDILSFFFKFHQKLSIKNVF